MKWNPFGPFRGHDLYIDLGTANTIVMDRVRGVIVNEPSVISYRETQSKRVVVSVGQHACTHIGKTPENVFTCYPLREGVIADLDTTKALLRYFLNKAKRSTSFTRPQAIISLPHGVSAVERKAVREAGIAAGARDVVLVEEPLLAAIGCNLPVHTPRGNMIIDIGAGTTEIAVISLNDIVHCESVRLGGNSFDQAIAESIRNHYDLIVGEVSAEKAKMEIGCALPNLAPMTTSIRGLDYASHLPKEITVSSVDIYSAMQNILNEILDAARRTLEAIPPELLPDIIDHGIYIVGGGALLRGLKTRFEHELKIPIHISPHPLMTVARGGEQVLKSSFLLENIRVA